MWSSKYMFHPFHRKYLGVWLRALLKYLNQHSFSRRWVPGYLGTCNWSPHKLVMSCETNNETNRNHCHDDISSWRYRYISHQILRKFRIKIKIKINNNNNTNTNTKTCYRHFRFYWFKDPKAPPGHRSQLCDPRGSAAWLGTQGSAPSRATIGKILTVNHRKIWISPSKKMILKALLGWDMGWTGYYVAEKKQPD